MNEIETFHGLIQSTTDAMCVFQLCRLGRLGRVRRRLTERERLLIRSGSVFVFDEKESGIKRWTDGRTWSPSRIMGNFLVYRELEKRPIKQEAPLPASDLYLNHHLGSSNASWTDAEQFLEPHHLFPPETTTTTTIGLQQSAKSGKTAHQSSLLGSQAERLLHSKKLQGKHHTSSTPKYHFKTLGGLFKKTISARIDGRMQHLVCYFDHAAFVQVHNLLDDSNTTLTAQQIEEINQSMRLMDELRSTHLPRDLLQEQRHFRRMPVVSKQQQVKPTSILYSDTLSLPLSSSGFDSNTSPSYTSATHIGSLGPYTETASIMEPTRYMPRDRVDAEMQRESLIHCQQLDLQTSPPISSLQTSSTLPIPWNQQHKDNHQDEEEEELPSMPPIEFNHSL